MNIDNIKYVYLIGIGGIGMSGLARYFNHLGYSVAGYDKTETALTRQLQEERIDISYEDDGSVITYTLLDNLAETLVIYTSAIPKYSKFISVFQNNGHALHKRSEVLVLFSARTCTIDVASRHV